MDTIDGVGLDSFPGIMRGGNEAWSEARAVLCGIEGRKVYIYM